MGLSAIDTSLFFAINRDLQNGVFDILMPFVTRRAYVFFLPLCIWVFLKDKRKAAAALVLGCASLLLSDWTANILKLYFERPRPCSELDGVRLLVGCSTSFSMPSNHAVNAFAFMTPFYFMMKGRVRFAFAVVAALVAFSRIYVGVHYPSDALAGAILGTLLGMAVIKFYDWSRERYREKPYSTVLIVCLLAVGLFRIYYILNGPLDLSPDEAHYWEWSRRPDLSYYSKGPMIAYLIYLGTHIFGDNVFGIRIMAVICSALSSIFLYRFGRRLYGESVGLSSALIFLIIPLFSVYGIVFTIDSPFIFFWILSLLVFWKAIGGEGERIHVGESSPPVIPDRPSPPAGKDGGEAQPYAGGRDFSMAYWRLLGLSVGLGLLTKYTMAFFYLCALLFLLTAKKRRRLLLMRGPYIAFVISVLVFAPVIIWNSNHDWVTLKHTAGQAHVAEGVRISLRSFFEFLGSQFGVITPLLFSLMAVSVWKIRREQPGELLFWFSVPVFAFFLLKSVQAKVQANWALPCYLTGIVAFSAFYMREFSLKGRGQRLLIAASLAVSLVVTSVAHYGSLLNLPAEMDPASRLTGWKDLGKEVSDIYERMSRARPVFIFSDRYQVSSELAFYVSGHPVTYCTSNNNRRMNQYDLWPGFEDFVGQDAIFVRTDDVRIPERVAAAFQRVEKKVFTSYTKKRAKIRDYSIFLCYDFKGLKEERPGTF